MSFLWESIAFGPIRSRRLGSSLGINLLPTDVKICSFDCIYCECGWTLEKKIAEAHFYAAGEVLKAIEVKLIHCKENRIAIDSITFSGNGEPTLHPQFGGIIEGLIQLRNQYYPTSVITCLSNSTQLHKESVLKALQEIENPILKLDAGTQEMLDVINKPIIPISIDEIVEHLVSFKGNLIIQTLFFAGEIEGVQFDNSSGPDFSFWLQCIEKIAPKKVMLYSLDRETPAQHLRKFTKEKLETIADKVREVGFITEVY